MSGMARIARPGWRSVLLALAVAAGGLALSAAQAKDFERGDLRACGAARCKAIADRGVLSTISRFYFGTRRLSEVSVPRMRAPYFDLRARNGYATGILAGSRLDRFLSYGVNIGRFRRGTWYRVPPRLAAGVRTLVAGLQPRRLDQAALRRAR